MHCRDCARYDQETGRCRDAKINPQTYGQAIEVSKQYGIRSICVFNDYRERLLLGRRLPCDRGER